MPEQPSVYSCPSCGALSKVDPSAGDGSACGECGYEFKRPVRVAPRKSSTGGVRHFVQRDVVSRRRQVVREKAALPPERPAVMEVDTIEEELSGRPEDQVVSDDGHKKVVRRRKKRRKAAKGRPLVLSVIWILIVIGAIVFFQETMNPDRSAAKLTEEQALRGARIAEMRAYIAQHLGDCHEVLKDFLNESEVEGRAQSVFAPLRVTPAMYRHHGQHGFIKRTPPIKFLGSNLVEAGDLQIIETAWKDGSGERFEVAFVRHEGAWKIDWEAYARFCSTRWEVFVPGTIQTEGDFRLYMRENEKLTPEERGEHIGLKFYPANYEVRPRRKTETVLVRADTELGKQVRAVLDELKDKIEVGESGVRAADQSGMARVRVLLEWQTNAEGKPSLHLNELKAGSWFAEEVVAALGAEETTGDDDGDAVKEGDGEDDGEESESMKGS